MLKQRIAQGQDTGKRQRAEVKKLKTTSEKLKNEEEKLERVHIFPYLQPRKTNLSYICKEQQCFVLSVMIKN